MFFWTRRISRLLLSKRLKYIIESSLAFTSSRVRCVGNGCVWQQLLLVGETQRSAKFGTQHARVLLLVVEKKVLLVEVSRGNYGRVSLWRQEAPLFWYAPISLPVTFTFYLLMLWSFLKFLFNP